MTVQPLQPSTYHNAGSFPSEPENYFRAVTGSVTTDVQPYWHAVDAQFQIGFAGSVTSIRLSVGLDTDENGAPAYPSNQIEIMRADLDHLHQQWTEFYAAATSALDEIPAFPVSGDVAA